MSFAYRQEEPRGIYDPPKHLLEELKRIDPNLTVAWHDEVDRWVVWEKTRMGWVEVRVVEGPNHEFEPLDGRFIRRCQLGDTWRRPRRWASVLDEVQKRNQDREAEERKRMHDACEDVARDIVDASLHKVRFSMSGVSSGPSDELAKLEAEIAASAKG